MRQVGVQSFVCYVRLPELAVSNLLLGLCIGLVVVERMGFHSEDLQDSRGASSIKRPYCTMAAFFHDVSFAIPHAAAFFPPSPKSPYAWPFLTLRCPKAFFRMLRFRGDVRVDEHGNLVCAGGFMCTSSLWYCTVKRVWTDYSSEVNVFTHIL